MKEGDYHDIQHVKGGGFGVGGEGEDFVAKTMTEFVVFDGLYDRTNLNGGKGGVSRTHPPRGETFF